MTTPTQETQSADAYAEGVDAANSGRSIADCPYDYGTPQGDSWCQGFTDTKGDDHD